MDPGDVGRELVPADAVQLGAQHPQRDREHEQSGGDRQLPARGGQHDGASARRPLAHPGQGLEQAAVEFAEVVAEAMIRGLDRPQPLRLGRGGDNPLRVGRR